MIYLFYDESMTRQLILDILPDAQPTFNNMVVGQNAQAMACARSLAPGQTLYLWGQDGSGRTHLLKSCVHHYGGQLFNVQTDPLQIAQLATSEGPMPTLVAIDDVHRLNESSQAACFTLYNRFKELSHSPMAFILVVSGDRAPLSMPIREDLRTRLGSGFVQRLIPLSDQEKIQALTQLAAEQSMPLAPPVLEWLLTHGSRDIRALWATLEALDRFALEQGQDRALTLPLLKAMLAKQPHS